ncbi:MAG: hypothetical protein JWN52_2802 [Actinomycetia bacterium]|jgi:hypothetical protein|nr:hypothetical protein [Actinomycetes bacterium]
MVDLEKFVVSAEFDSLPPGSGYAAARDMFGEPELMEPGRRGRPMFVKYGDVEFTFRDDFLTKAAFSLERGAPVDGGSIQVQGFWPESKRTREAVGELLAANDVSWELDVLMSSISTEESSQVWITERDVHLAFFEGILQRAVASYGSFQRQ